MAQIITAYVKLETLEIMVKALKSKDKEGVGITIA